MVIKAIETYYNGYKFRSRLEARWAIFFDSLNIEYQYEPEGFETSEGYYLPDFYLPKLNLWVEIKGVMSDYDQKRIDAFRENFSRRLIVLADIPSEYEDLMDYIQDKYGYDWGSFEIGFDFPYLPCICPACGKAGFEFDGRGWRICGHLRGNEDKERYFLENRLYVDSLGKEQKMMYPEYAGRRMDDKGYSYNHPKIKEAFRKARQARFEHGEQPKTIH